MIDFAFPYLLQVWICLWLYLSTDEIYSFFAKHFEIYFCLKFIREYTGKIDELIKDKIEAQNEEKAKEKEEKEVLAQQVPFVKPSIYHSVIFLFDY